MANRTVTVRTGGIGVDTRDFRNVANALRRAAPQTYKALRSDLREAGMIVAEEAKSIAGEFSEKIPPTVKVRVASTTVSVVAGGKNAPTAGLFELGNTGSSKSAAASRRGQFRHPVFGNKEVWVDQDMHPFLTPAAERTAPRFTAKLVETLDEVTHTITFGE